VIYRHGDSFCHRKIYIIFTKKTGELKNMELQLQEVDNSAMIRVEGKLTATRLEESLRGMVKDLIIVKHTKEIVIDMSTVIHMDSTGVGELVSAYTTASNEDVALYLLNVPEMVMELLETTNLLEIFTILETDATEVVKFA
jgi:anti-sigma B factor antagonist